MSLLNPAAAGIDADPGIYRHSHGRTISSSSNMPYDYYPPQGQQPYLGGSQQPYLGSSQQAGYGYHAQTHARAPSANTFSSGSSGGMINNGYPPGQPAIAGPESADLRRSISSRSGGSTVMQPSSYVALLRKQKATVWCDRQQTEDAHLSVQRARERRRARQEIYAALGSNTSAGSAGTGVGSAGGGGGGGSGKMGAKIRHYKATAVSDYTPGENHVGVGGVPMRLSATEVEGESSGDDEQSGTRMHHRRTGSSGRSSIGSGRRGAGAGAPYWSSSGGGGGGSGGGGGLGSSQGSGRRKSPGDTPERPGSLAEERPEELADEMAGELQRTASFRSGNSAERLDTIGELGGASGRPSKSLAHANMTRDKGLKSVEDLKRRGSVDERTSTLTGTGRLFIANPD